MAQEIENDKNKDFSRRNCYKKVAHLKVSIFPYGQDGL